MSNQRFPFGLVTGLLIIAAGSLLLAKQFDLISGRVSGLLFSWQMILIIIGIFSMRNRQGVTNGLILCGIGIFFLIPKIFMIHDNFYRSFWPLILVVIGAIIIFRNLPGRKADTGPQMYESATADERIDEVNIFSGTKKVITSRQFRGGKITTIFGGLELDLRNAELGEGKNEIEFTCIFGGTTIWVPVHWNVQHKVDAILGGFTDARRTTLIADNPGKVLIIKGTVIFGGGEIKS
jgi:predicted membrane protein